MEGCIDKLPAKSKKLLELRYEDGASAMEIAEVMKSSAASVRVLLHRVRTCWQIASTLNYGRKAPLSAKSNKGTWTVSRMGICLTMNGSGYKPDWRTIRRPWIGLLTVAWIHANLTSPCRGGGLRPARRRWRRAM